MDGMAGVRADCGDFVNSADSRASLRAGIMPAPVQPPTPR